MCELGVSVSEDPRREWKTQMRAKGLTRWQSVVSLVSPAGWESSPHHCVHVPPSAPGKEWYGRAVMWLTFQRILRCLLQEMQWQEVTELLFSNSGCILWLYVLDPSLSRVQLARELCILPRRNAGGEERLQSFHLSRSYLGSSRRQMSMTSIWEIGLVSGVLLNLLFTLGSLIWFWVWMGPQALADKAYLYCVFYLYFPSVCILPRAKAWSH